MFHPLAEETAMVDPGNGKISYLKKVFYLTHLTGLAAGGLFPVLVYPILGEPALRFSFVLACLLMGFGIAALMFLMMRRTLKNQLGQQLKMLQSLAGETLHDDGTVEGLQEAVGSAVGQVEAFVKNLIETVDTLLPHYRSLAESSRFLAEKAQDGLAAAKSTRRDVQAMDEKQQEVHGQVQTLGERSQNEAALSRQLATSLAEMSDAMEHTTSQFLETSTGVNELTSNISGMAERAEQVARSVEGTARDLDLIRDSMVKIRTGAQASARAVGAVKTDARDGLLVVQAAMEEMERIELESQRATQAMQRLSRQTVEVGKIIEVIKELVSDTELLAFNAAIIAARAGEEGKGFSVVAEEIRDLADRTTASAQDIHRIVKAIGGDTGEVTAAVEATSQRIAKGKQLSLSAGEALSKIADSSQQAATATSDIAALTSEQGERATGLLEDAGNSLRSVKAIARAIQEQQVAIRRIQEGVTEMKSAADQISRGMEEQVRANQEFSRGLVEREEQICTITEATRFQMATVKKVFDHFATSETRLQKNAEKADGIRNDLNAMEALAKRLREMAANFRQ
jgi:methyl-accepting chemotaxis protein